MSKTSATVTIYSKVNGTVSDIAIHEGDYVTEGMAILKTQGLANLWIEAQLYAGESGNYKENDMVNVSFPDLNGQVVKGKVEFVNPELSDESKGCAHPDRSSKYAGADQAGDVGIHFHW